MPAKTCTTFTEARELLTDKSSVKIGSNRVLKPDLQGNIVLWAYDTNLVTYHVDGTVTLNHGGWITQSTIRYINEHTKLRAYREKSLPYVRTGEETVALTRGVTVNNIAPAWPGQAQAA